MSRNLPFRSKQLSRSWRRLLVVATYGLYALLLWLSWPPVDSLWTFAFLCIAIAWLWLPFGRPWLLTQEPDRRLDEREQGVRNHAYHRAYRTVGLLIGALAVYGLLPWIMACGFPGPRR